MGTCEMCESKNEVVIKHDAQVIIHLPERFNPAMIDIEMIICLNCQELLEETYD